MRQRYPLARHIHAGGSAALQRRPAAIEDGLPTVATSTCGTTRAGTAPAVSRPTRPQNLTTACALSTGWRRTGEGEELVLPAPALHRRSPRRPPAGACRV